MAALLLGAGALAYDQIQKTRTKRRSARLAHNDARFSALEKEHALRVTPADMCTCREENRIERREVVGGRCGRCGGVVKEEEVPGYSEVDRYGGVGGTAYGAEERSTRARDAVGGEGMEGQGNRAGWDGIGDGDGDEVARVNEERRGGAGKKAGGLGKFFRGRKGRGMEGVGSMGADGVVR